MSDSASSLTRTIARAAPHVAALAAAPAQDGSASSQYFRRIVFMSKSATRHQNFRLGFETVKNARADSLAHLDSFPARVGFFKS